MNPAKTVAALHDLSGVGRCALTVAIPVISAMGVQVIPAPTAVLSAHTAFPDFVSQDLTDFLVVSKLVKEFTAFNEPVDEDNAVHQEVFAYDISEVMEAMVQSELDTVRIPTAYMQKEDKRAIVERLKAKGIFDIKGSVEYVAERLGVTNFTIYNYLKEVRCTQR